MSLSCRPNNNNNNDEIEERPPILSTPTEPSIQTQLDFLKLDRDQLCDTANEHKKRIIELEVCLLKSVQTIHFLSKKLEICQSSIEELRVSRHRLVSCVIS